MPRTWTGTPTTGRTRRTRPEMAWTTSRGRTPRRSSRRTARTWARIWAGTTARASRAGGPSRPAICAIRKGSWTAWGRYWSRVPARRERGESFHCYLFICFFSSGRWIGERENLDLCSFFFFFFWWVLWFCEIGKDRFKEKTIDNWW